ncbi:hypothetical protein H0E87_024545, partial [Populus deltoides]
ETLLFWYGPFPIITIADPELAKQVLSNKLGLYIKPSMRYPIDTLLGKGLVLLNALDWARHRTILNKGFSMDKLKVMIGRMAACRPTSGKTGVYLPTPSNIQVWKRDRKVKNTLRQVIESRTKSQVEISSKDCYGYDVLGLMVESLQTTGNEDSPKLNMDEVIEECKTTFFFAGQERPPPIY